MKIKITGCIRIIANNNDLQEIKMTGGIGTKTRKELQVELQKFIDELNTYEENEPLHYETLILNVEECVENWMEVSEEELTNSMNLQREDKITILSAIEEAKLEFDYGYEFNNINDFIKDKLEEHTGLLEAK